VATQNVADGQDTDQSPSFLTVPMTWVGADHDVPL
jgi:hypothetical protein